MTENMAGRGEGLAGLRERLTEHFRRIGMGNACQLADIAMAEAAAPAGTPPPVKHVSSNCPNCGSGDKPLTKIRGYSTVNNQWWLSLPGGECDHPWHIGMAALATPSPQAPQDQSNSFFTTFSTTSVLEQSSATASNGPGGVWVACLDTLPRDGEIVFVWDKGWNSSYIAQFTKEGWESGDDHEEPENQSDITHWMRYPRKPELPAATQEPAGSGASESVNCICGHPAVRQAPPRCERWPKCYLDFSGPTEQDIKRGQEIARELGLGPPRKVGEDGAQPTFADALREFPAQEDGGINWDDAIHGRRRPGTNVG